MSQQEIIALQVLKNRLNGYIIEYADNGFCWKINTLASFCGTPFAENVKNHSHHHRYGTITVEQVKLF